MRPNRSGAEKTGDFVIVLGAILAALLFVAAGLSSILTLKLTGENNTLIRQVTELTQDNHALVQRSDRNHADSVVIEKDLQAFCTEYRVKCVVVTPPKPPVTKSTTTPVPSATTATTATTTVPKAAPTTTYKAPVYSPFIAPYLTTTATTAPATTTPVHGQGATHGKGKK